MRSRSKLTVLCFLTVFVFSTIASAGEQPIAIFHAFDQPYLDVEAYVCELQNQGYSHIQIAPAQKSNPSDQWWARYQPIDYTVIEGMGSESNLKTLIDKAHGCGMKVIADVVFNHMANIPEYSGLNFPGISKENFHPRCPINPGDYSDGNRDLEINCWLGDLPDLDQTKETVQAIQKKHLKMLLNLGIDGFRFDAAKHMSPDIVKMYIDYIDRESNGTTWNYLEVIEDNDTKAEDYNWIAAVTDFLLYHSMKNAFSFGGDLRSLKVPKGVNDPRSVTFGRNHDNIQEINSSAIDPYADRTDSYLATAYVLARQSGTPLILNWDNYDSPFIKYGVKFRQIMTQRAKWGENVNENVLAAIDSPTVLIMERGNQGFFVENKGNDRFDTNALDLTLTNLEGCYRELRNNFYVAIERRDGKKYVTRWGTWNRGGLEVQGRDVLYFIREPWSQCQMR
jgi:alpha-amylase